MSELVPSTESLLAELAWLRALARHLVRDPHRAEDAVQEVAVVALTEPRPELGSLRAWLATVMRNAVRQERRASTRREAREEGAAGLGRDNEPAAVDVAEQLCWHRRVVALVHELEEPYRTAIALRFLHGRTVRDIARELGVPPKTIHTRIERGIARLRARLDREAGGHGAWMTALLPLARSKAGWLGLAPATWMVAMNAKQIGVGLGIVVVCGLFSIPFWSSPSTPLRTARDNAAARTELAGDSGSISPMERGDERRAIAAPAAANAAPKEVPLPVAAVSVTGAVLDMQGRAVAGIEVVFEPRAPNTEADSTAPVSAQSPASPFPSVHTEQNGSFVFQLPSVRGSLSVADEQYASVVRPYLDGSPPAVPPTIIVAPRREYSGRVVDEQGLPVAGAAVEVTLDGPWLNSSALGFSGPGGQTVHLLLPLYETQSNGRGEFAFPMLGLVAGAHVAATRDGFTPGRTDLPESSRRDLLVVLEKAEASERALRGVVLDAEGAPVPDALVSLGRGSVRSAPDGTFALELEEWQKGGILRAVKRNHLPGELEVTTTPIPVTPLVLRLGPEPLSIRGRVVDGTGAPVAGVAVWSPDSTYFGQANYEVRGKPIFGEVTVEGLVSGSEASDSGPTMTIESRTDEQGRFELTGLAPRGYAVLALEPHTLAAAAPVVVEAGKSDVVLQLERAAPRRIAGRVLSRRGQPLANVQVSAGRSVPWTDPPPPRTTSWNQGFMRPPSNSKTFRDTLASTDAEGRFEIAGLVVEGSNLLLRGTSIVLSERVALDGKQDLENLEIRVDASSRFRVVLDDPREADRFTHVAENPQSQPLFVEIEGHVISTPDIEIVEGRSGIVQCAEGRGSLVLFKNGIEVRRVDVDFAPGGVQEVRL